MTLLSRQRVALLLVLAVTTALYLYGLDRAPVYVGGDEAHFADGGYTIAKSGRNVNGDRFPLFFNLADPLGDPVKMPWGDTWYHPMLFYLIAVVLKIGSITDATVRLPTALIGGLLTPWLVYLVPWKRIIWQNDRECDLKGHGNDRTSQSRFCRHGS